MTLKEQVEAFFSEEGPLGKPLRRNGREFVYELRPQQTAMAVAVAEALEGRSNLCVEAPTGVGKTFAYLVPAIFHARATGKAVVISTHTIPLQEQILRQDIPLLEEVLHTEIRGVVAKGRSRFLCLRRLNALQELDQGLLEFDGPAGEIGKLQRWADYTETGDQSELPPAVSMNLWSMVCCERGNCAGGQCPFQKKCFLQRAKRRLRDAELVISNHAKFFTEMCSEEDGEGSFPAFDGVIFDEAHTMEDAAADHLGLRADSYALRYALNRLYSPARKTGLFATDAYGELRDLVTYCLQSMDLFFPRLVEWVRMQNHTPLRYHTPNHIQNYMGQPLEALLLKLEVAEKSEEDASRRAEIKSAHMEIGEQAKALETFFSMSQPECVYWFELAGRNQEEVNLNVVPVDIAGLLREQLFSRAPVVLTSATLAIHGDIRYFQGRIGCEDSRALVLDTPFDYPKQVKVFVARNMPSPQERELYQERAVSYLQEYLAYTKGRAFVLFTSYRTMQDIAERLKNFFRREKLTLLMQGEDLAPRRMLEKFRETEGAVIFGTASFWTGVDVPGDALQNVIIMRLPFAVPDDPLTAARMERVEGRGGNSFLDYSVPEAVLKFRQGFGRLIRTKQDTGIVVILDSRVAMRHYGRVFLDSIPSCPVEFI